MCVCVCEPRWPRTLGHSWLCSDGFTRPQNILTVRVFEPSDFSFLKRKNSNSVDALINSLAFRLQTFFRLQSVFADVCVFGHYYNVLYSTRCDRLEMTRLCILEEVTA